MPIIHISLHSTEYYKDKDNCNAIRKSCAELCKKEKLSREKLYEDASMIFALPNIKVYIPLRGNVKGRQEYIIPGIENLGDPRWLSYFLKDDKNGNQKHPTRLTERVRMLHLYLKIKERLENDT